MSNVVFVVMFMCSSFTFAERLSNRGLKLPIEPFGDSARVVNPSRVRRHNTSHRRRAPHSLNERWTLSVNETLPHDSSGP